MGLDRIEDAVAAIAAGRMVVVVDDEGRENEGDLIMAAADADERSLAFIVNHSSGVVCVPMLADDLHRLELPLMVERNQDPKGTAYTVSVDAASGVSTGISAADRARTIRLLADPATGPGDLARPGHVFPLRYRAGGVLRRPGHTEAAVDLVRMAGRGSAGVIAELVNPDGSMQRLDDLRAFAARHGLPIVSIEDLVAVRRREGSIVERVAEASLPTDHGEWRVHAYRSTVDSGEHLALVLGDVEGRSDVLVRVHSECLTGDVFGSLRCDCGPQLDLAMRTIARAGAGVIVYLRGHEGRGIGLAEKLRAYALQDRGADTVDANVQLGLPVDARDYGIGASILVDLGLTTLRLLTNNPAKRAGLGGFGLSVTERVPLEVESNIHNTTYLLTKADRMGHQIRPRRGRRGVGMAPLDEGAA